MLPSESASGAGGGARGFLTTRWSLVVAAAGEGDAARASLEELARGYWYPLYAFVRRQGERADDAADLTQAFFLRLLERRDLAVADPERGRFRSFLLASLRHFLANERDARRALKRGGGRAPLSIDWGEADRRFGAEPADERDPELLFERGWALATLERALERLRAEYAARGKSEQFERLAPELSPGGRSEGVAEIAVALDTSEGAVRVALHRLRERFRDALRAEVADTLARPDELDLELAELLRALG